MAAPVSGEDFIIWGPAVTSGTAVVNAVHALYYLPSQFKLVLPAATQEELGPYLQVQSLIRRDGLAGRVRFTGKQVEATWQAVIVNDRTDHCPGHVFGRSPEALASAILNVARHAR